MNREIPINPTARMPTRHGEFKIRIFPEPDAGGEHVVLVHGDVEGEDGVLVRMHSKCLTGDVFASCRCDCGEQLAIAMKLIVSEGRGIVLYLDQEGRGIGLSNKIEAYKLQDLGFDTIEANHKLGFEADLRDYRMAAYMLRVLNVSDVRLLTNNPAKVDGLKRHGISVKARVPLLVAENAHRTHYMATKRERMGHIYDERNTP